MAGQEVTYTQIREYRTEKAIIKVYKPDLTEEERQRRMKHFIKQCENLLKDAMQLEKKGVNGYGT